MGGRLSKPAREEVQRLAEVLKAVETGSISVRQEIWNAAMDRMEPRAWDYDTSDLTRFFQAILSLAKDEATCNGKVVEIDGKKYELKEVT